MDFNFSDDQNSLREAVAKWVEKGFDFNRRLNQIHDEAIARFGSLAKSTGQRTRADRIHRSTGIGY